MNFHRLKMTHAHSRHTVSSSLCYDSSVMGVALYRLLTVLRIPTIELIMNGLALGDRRESVSYHGRRRCLCLPSFAYSVTILLQSMSSRAELPAGILSITGPRLPRYSSTRALISVFSSLRGPWIRTRRIDIKRMYV